MGGDILKGLIFNKDKKATELPELYSYTLKHGMGLPCDSFEVACEYVPGLEYELQFAKYFAGMHNGGVVFTGIVDEYEISCDLAGKTLSIAGRGIAALLLDNEAVPAVYENCSLDVILRNHVIPFGITDIEWEDMGSCRGYTVESGMSQWTALYNFTKYVGGITPRFSRGGKLILTDRPGDLLLLDGNRISEYRLRERRHGVISEVVLRENGGGVVKTVKNSAFIERGGLARRVVTLPRKPGYDAIRYTGEFQIGSSEEESATCTVTVPERFAAFPGDIVMFGETELNLTGEFKVIETETWANASGCGTKIVMTPERK